MTAAPPVSIGLPVHNGGRFLAAALDSLLAQTFGDFRVIVCDNASTDDTQAICRDYAAKDRRVQYVRHAQNIGAARNYRRSFELSSSSFFRWANADDVSAPTLIERCLEALRHDSQAVLAYGRTAIIDEHGRLAGAAADDLHLPIPSASVRFRRVVERLGLCNVIYGLMRSDALKRTRLIGSYIGSDRVFVAELALYGGFVEVPEVLFYRRFHAAAYSSCRSTAELLRFYNPTTRARVALPAWRRLAEYTRAVHRSPIPVAEKLELVGYLARHAVWHRRRLAEELRSAVRQLARP